MRLHDLLDHVATADEPPGRPVDGADLYATAMRRRRVTMGARAAGAAVLGVALIGSVLVAVTPDDRRDATTTPGASHSTSPGVEPSVPAQSAEATPAGMPPGPWPVGSVGGHGQHLYAFTGPVCACVNHLWGSNDGGKTWTFRQTDVIGGDDIFVSPSGTVMSAGLDPGKGPSISVDGGRTSTPAKEVTDIEGAPDDQVTYCDRRRGDGPQNSPAAYTCEVVAVDLRAGGYGPLRNQPDLEPNLLRTGDNVLWVAGSVRTGDRRVMAVTRSTDGGRTWQRQEFAETGFAEPGGTVGVYPELLIGRDGTVVADFVYDTPAGQRRYIARTTGGAWQRLTGLDELDANPLSGRLTRYSYVDADGTHVVSAAGPKGWDLVFRAARRGETVYRPIARPAGLPTVTGEPWSYVTYLPGNGYALFSAGVGLWLSPDARTWRQVKLGG
ncbi:hypothetical protein [Virgisporangium ochraceum]|uniref:Uncharacterized protein n=1 Tax=Virgisporangium ochraceum TaxID=65505 RepID=A0A8J4EAG9_9ACTN|nr:hypothetical protein [Virgisporangium ochraceum]GIJ68275.1 hypothetical protein Voc01_031920 [Virgisporangium ochraceum]